MNSVCEEKEVGGKRYRCFFELTLQVIGGKWKPVILNHLAVTGTMRFGELKRGIDRITEKMLTQQLRELAADGLVHREVYHQVPPKVEYSLTEVGRTLIPVLMHMREWGVSYERYLNGGENIRKEGFESPDRILAYSKDSAA